LKKIVFKLFLSVIVFLLITNCGAKKIFYEPYAAAPDTLLTKQTKKELGKEKYQEYKKRKKIISNQWKKYEKLRKMLTDKNFDNFDKLLKELEDYQDKHKNILKYDEYYYGAIYYSGIKQLLQYNFSEAEKIFKNIPESSIFYIHAQNKIKNLNADTDGDGYIDEWENLEGFNPLNPYSHP